MTSSSNDSKLQDVASKLSKISSSMARGARITAFVGIILMVLMLGYFAYGYNEIKDLTKPENLVALGGQLVDESLPQVLNLVKNTVESSAPDWAQALSDQAIGATPTIRESLEDHILAETEGVIANGASLGENEFR